MNDLVTLHDHPPLHDPVLVVTLEGWIDAGAAAAGAARQILEAHPTEPVATFDSDQLLDFRSRRPVMGLVDSVVERLVWPSIELRALVDGSGNHVLLLIGAEPDHAWGAFTRCVVDVAGELGARMVVGLGAYPAPVPHTRDVQLALTSPSRSLTDSYQGFTRGTVEVPAGVQTAIEVAASEAGIPALGLWAQVPHYISGLSYPAGSVALLDGLARVAGVTVVRGELPAQSAETRSQIDQLVEGNEQHQNMVHQLEGMFDQAVTQAQSGFGPLPTGDELAAELQAYLRDHREPGA